MNLLDKYRRVDGDELAEKGDIAWNRESQKWEEIPEAEIGHESEDYYCLLREIKD